MIVFEWMWGTVLVGLAAAAAAAVLEGAMAGAAARRFAWMGAIIAGLALPVVLSATGAPGAIAAVRNTSDSVISGAGGSRTASFALAGWALLSAAVLANLVIGFRGMRRQTRHAEPVEVFGHRVYLCDFGPAVIGFVRPRAMIPRWVSGLPQEDQRLIVAHEAEHVAGGDQLLLLVGLSGVVLMPWSPAAWIALHRLRRAIELDCDARVAAGSDAVRYGNVLLEARLRGPIAPVFNLAFARPAIQTRVESLLAPHRATLPEILARGAGAAVALCAVLLVAMPPFAAMAAQVAPQPAGEYRIIGEQRGDSIPRPRGVVRPMNAGANRARFTGPSRDSVSPARGGTAPSRARFTPARPDTVTPF